MSSVILWGALRFGETNVDTTFNSFEILWNKFKKRFAVSNNESITFIGKELKFFWGDKIFM